MSIVSVHIASNKRWKRWKLRSSTTLANIPNVPYISRNSIIHLHFPADSLSIFIQFFSGGRRNFPQDFSISKRGAFRPFKVNEGTDIGANRKRVCDFLLVRSSNLGPILHRFGDLTGFMCYLPHPLFNPNFNGVPVAPDRPCWASTGTWTLSYSAMKLFSKNSNVFEHGTWSLRTDRRTDRQTIYCRITALCASIAR